MNPHSRFLVAGIQVPGGDETTTNCISGRTHWCSLALGVPGAQFFRSLTLKCRRVNGLVHGRFNRGQASGARRSAPTRVWAGARWCHSRGGTRSFHGDPYPPRPSALASAPPALAPVRDASFTSIGHGERTHVGPLSKTVSLMVGFRQFGCPRRIAKAADFVEGLHFRGSSTGAGRDECQRPGGARKEARHQRYEGKAEKQGAQEIGRR